MIISLVRLKIGLRVQSTERRGGGANSTMKGTRMAYTCGCGYKTSKGGKAVAKHEQSCGANKKSKLFKGDRNAKALNKPKK